MSFSHLIDLNHLSSDRVEEILTLADDVRLHPEQYLDACKGKIMATLFYEPSTRTQMSFQAAMLRLGGQVIGFDNPQNTSAAKGENLKDTVKIISGYSDIVVIRHPVEGAAKAASLYSGCPVINAGDGGHLHPTQTLTDLCTLRAEKGRLDHLTIGLCGDLKNGRTVHSLIKEMLRYPGNRFVFISTKELAVPSYLKSYLDANGGSYTEVYSLEEAIPQLDVLYMTRIQQERFSSLQEYEEQKHVYILTKGKLEYAKPDLKILHPLPRVDEIETDVDDDSRAVYFKQAVYGMYARMGLILTMLRENTGCLTPARYDGDQAHVCSNPKCITNHETYVPKLFEESGSMLTCAYCDQRTLI